MIAGGMRTFVLVHGAWHGAWCWERLAAELERRGHGVISGDLPIDRPGAGLAAYAETVAGWLPDTDDLVLVGHSLGASVIPLVAANLGRPVAQVYLCPVVRILGHSLADGAAEDEGAATYDLSHGRTFFDDESSAWQLGPAMDAFYNECGSEVAAWAAERLRRQYWAYWEEPNPLTAWPPGPRRAIVCTDDRLVSPTWARRVLPGRLGVEPEEMPGDHSPFLSHPATLAERLVNGL